MGEKENIVQYMYTISSAGIHPECVEQYECECVTPGLYLSESKIHTVTYRVDAGSSKVRKLF